MTRQLTTEEERRHNTGLVKVAVQCSADTFVVNQTLVLRINIWGKNRHLRQAAKRRQSSLSNRTSGRKIFKKVKLDEVMGDWFIG